MKYLKRIYKYFAGKRYFEHYQSLDTLPLWNWFQILETDNLKYLYHDFENAPPAPESFKGLFIDMVFQMPHIDLTTIKIQAEIAYYKSKSVTDKNPRYKYEAAAKEKELTEMLKANHIKEKPDLYKFINYIEVTFKSIGSINPRIFSTKRAYSLYHEAVKINNIKGNGND